jgi:hypothetical protein
MNKRQLTCAIISAIAFGVVIIEAVAGGHDESLRIFAGTIGAAGGFAVIAHIP